MAAIGFLLFLIAILLAIASKQLNDTNRLLKMTQAQLTAQLTTDTAAIRADIANIPTGANGNISPELEAAAADNHNAVAELTTALPPQG